MTATLSRTPSYNALSTRQLRLHRLGHLQSLATWDRMTLMPAGRSCAAARSAAQSELESLLQDLREDPRFDAHFAHAPTESLTTSQRRNLELMDREHRLTRAVPAELAMRLVSLRQATGAVWREARIHNDWGTFEATLTPLVAAVREQAGRIGDVLSVSSYDALIDMHEPGMRYERIAELFGDVSRWLPGLVAEVKIRQKDTRPTEPVGPFAIQSQRQLCERVMKKLGFDFDAGRLDVSAHPFTGGVPEDVRLTTRFHESSFMPALLAAMHETGHACYQQHLPREWLGQPLSGPHSAALHEGQALTFERQLAPCDAFVQTLSPMLVEAFGPQRAFEASNLSLLMRRVRPGRIRVEADELTYPAHVILRVEIEQALIDGAIEVSDIPDWWDERMRTLLDIDTRGDFANGPLQDIHWSQGMFGYFPSYLLGAMVAAQCMEALRRDVPNIDQQIASGELSPIGEWLDSRIWGRGAWLETDALMKEATGHVLGGAALQRHLKRRYAGQ